MQKNVIICDIDGVILDFDWKNIDDFYNNLDKCVPNQWAIDLLYKLKGSYLADVVFMTAREGSEKYRKQTQIQLEKLFDFNFSLYMIPRQHIHIDWHVKKHMVEEYLRHHDDVNIVLAIDDNPYNCEMFKEYFNIPSLQVRYNKEFKNV